MEGLPKAVVFDLDDTLADSFKPPKPEIVEKLGRLLEYVPVGILSAAGFGRIEANFLHHLASSPRIDYFYVLANSAAQCYVHENGAWHSVYDLMLSSEDRAKITQAINESVAEIDLELNPKYEPLIIDRDVQIAYAALGLNATEEDKASWDADKTKRKRLKEALDKRLPEFEVLIGGKTTIDITHKGINKAYGVKWLAERLGIPISEMLYVGDAFYEGGNDAIVVPTGVSTQPVANPTETDKFIAELISKFEIG